MINYLFILILFLFPTLSFAITPSRCNSTIDSFISFAYNANYSKSYSACFFPYNGYVYYILIDIVTDNSLPWVTDPDFFIYSHLASVPVPFEYPGQALLNVPSPVPVASVPVPAASVPVPAASVPASVPVPAASVPAVPASFALAPTLPHTSDMNPFPSVEAGVTTAISIAATMVGTIGVAVGAPLIASSFAFATAVGTAVMSIPGVARDFSPDSVFAKNQAPLIVYFTPAADVVSAVSSTVPAGGGSSSASSAVSVASDGRFVPTGAAAASSTDGGGWSPTANGGATFTPAPTAANPTPVATAVIGDWGASISQLTPAGSVTVTRASGGSFVVTNSASIPVVDSSGTATTAHAFVSDVFTSPSSTSPSVAPSVSFGSTFGNGSSVGAGGFSVGGVSGTGVGSLPGSGSGSGGCSSGDCATESTQRLNSGFLSKIAYFFTSSGEASNLPDSKTGADVKGAGLNKNSASFSQLLGFRLPSHSSTCPVSSFQWSGSTYVFDAHCKLVTDNFDVLRSVMTAMFSLSALFVVLKA